MASLRVHEDPTLNAGDLRLYVHGADGPFGELSRRGIAQSVENGTILVHVPQNYPQSVDPVTKEQLQCSYVIDCNDGAFQNIGLEKLSIKPSVDALVKFASAHIQKKALSRGFDLASEVARSREGDCSEHAVLLAAIARLRQRPARVVLGFAVIRFTDRLPMLMGHAWTEIHDGNAWVLADAALDDLSPQPVPNLVGISYLPLQLLRREDAGFRVALVTEPGPAFVDQADARN